MSAPIPALIWRAEALRLRRQPIVWMALGALALVLLAAAVASGLEARAWRQAAALDASSHEAALTKARALWRTLEAPGRAAATATYQLGRGELGATRMPVAQGLALGVQRLAVLPVQVSATLDSRPVVSRSPGPLRNPLLLDGGLPSVPAMVALVLPLVALVLCAGLRQEELEAGRLGLLRVQASRGLGAVFGAALGWRWAALVVVAGLATAPALLLDPAATLDVALAWGGALLLFCAVWVGVGALLSWAPVSGANALLAALGLWLLATFAVPAALIWGAERVAPMPSRLSAIVAIRDAQLDSDQHEAELAAAWYAAHRDVPATLPAVWPASVLPRVLHEDRTLRPLLRRFDDQRAAQAAFIERWSWLSPGLWMVLKGEQLAGTDTASHLRYQRAVDEFEDRWRAALIPSVMDQRGLSAAALEHLPRFQQARVAPGAEAP